MYPENNEPDWGDETLSGVESDILGSLDDGADNAPPQPDADPNASQQEGDTGAVPAGQQPADGGSGTKDAGSQQQPEPSRRVDRSRSDDKGNLIDNKGNIIAKAGTERRLYGELQAASRHISNVEQRLAQAEQARDQNSLFTQLPEKKGITLSDAELGMDIMAQFKKDPLSVVRWALSETMNLGYTLEQITDAKGGAPVTAQVIERIIDERLSKTNQSPASDPGREVYDAFVANHPNAEMHGNEIATIMQKGTPAREAYLELKTWALENGFDWNQPLRPQWEAKQNQGNGGNGNPPNNGSAQPASAPNMAPMPNGGGTPNSMQSQPSFANPDDSWDSIVGSSLREAGYTR